MRLYRIQIDTEFDKELLAAAASSALGAAAACLIISFFDHEFVRACGFFVFSIALATRLGLGHRSGMRLVTGFAAGVLAAVVVLLSSSYAAFSSMLFGAFVNAPPLIECKSTRKRIQTLVSSALSGYGASLVYAWFLENRTLDTLFPHVITQLIAGAAFGLIVGMGLLPLSLKMEADRVEMAYRHIRKRLAREPRQQADRTMERYRKISDFLSARSPIPETLIEELWEAVQSTSLKTLQLIELLNRLNCGHESGKPLAGNETDIKSGAVWQPGARREELTKSIQRCLEFLDRVELNLAALGFWEADKEGYMEQIMRLLDLLGEELSRAGTGPVSKTC